ncbi:8897_t:CDS:2 [Ambispora leptoticha]|uniref:8897_t:CDS:1 n=1 Tax=Ambispora leptoticha TaxID=144679 RepID=A0A9N9FFG8_9GLOM|nr:8897_t:CDS:2 [Ambispora leptoticha]
MDHLQDINKAQEHPFGINHNNVQIASQAVLDLYGKLSCAPTDDKQIRLLAALKCFLSEESLQLNSAQ